jgi:hypothetical protein
MFIIIIKWCKRNEEILQNLDRIDSSMWVRENPTKLEGKDTMKEWELYVWVGANSFGIYVF